MARFIFKLNVLSFLICLGCSKCQQSNGALIGPDQANNTHGTEGVALPAFKARFPKAQDVSWDSVETGFAASFYDGTNQSVAFYDRKGQFQYLTTTVELEALPAVIQRFIQKKFTPDDIALIQKVEDVKDKIFHIELKTDKDYINVDFDMKGNLLKETKVPLSNQELQSEEEEGVEK